MTDMKEVRELSAIYYRALPPEVQARAHEFFKSLDTDGDEQVDIPEFLSLMRKRGYTDICNPYFFKELDQDGDGTLGFMEAMTLYYIIKCGRPFCKRCASFIPGVFFSCVVCCKTSDGPVSLCLVCYLSGKFIHNHTQFLDNYALLEAHKDSTPAQVVTPHVQNPSSSSPMPSNSTPAARAATTTTSHVQNPSSSSPMRSNSTPAARAANTTDQIMVATTLISAGSSIANVVSDLDLDYGEISTNIGDFASNIGDAVSDIDCSIM